MAIASLVCGILWIYWVGSLLAIILGFVAWRRIKAADHRQRGRGIALAGIILGSIGLIMLLFFVALLSGPGPGGAGVMG